MRKTVISNPLSSEFLDTELLSRLPNLEIRARFLVSGFLSGLHKSPFRGSSVEFKEFRDYQPGDELKLIDWKAYARTDRLHVKLREEETNMTVNILLDKSASMNYRSGGASMTKWDYARSLVAAFLLFLHRQRDAASLSFIGEKLETMSRPSTRSSHFHQLMAALHRDSDSRESRIADCFASLLPLVRMRSMVLVFSDFYEEAQRLKNILSHMRRLKCEILLFHILDPAEHSFDFEDSILLEELETSEKIHLSPDLVRKEYAEKIEHHMGQIRDLCADKSEYIILNTKTSPIHALGKYLAKRKLLQ
jgi:uncharacterized protein (DUF58 family)